MANTTADKLALLQATKADLKAALAEKGQTVGDVFSTYPAAVRAIETGGVETVTVNYNISIPITTVTVYYCSKKDDGSIYWESFSKNLGSGSISVVKNTILATTGLGFRIVGGSLSESLYRTSSYSVLFIAEDTTIDA